MQIGALIVAAGMSKRMGEFKPMLSIGHACGNDQCPDLHRKASSDCN